MAGHAQLKFVMTECSKTGLILSVIGQICKKRNILFDCAVIAKVKLIISSPHVTLAFRLMGEFIV